MRTIVLTLAVVVLMPSALLAQDDADSKQTTLNRQAAEQTCQVADEAARQAARVWREATSSDDPDTKQIEAARSQLQQALTAAFQARTELQRVRLSEARRNLDRVGEKLQRREKLAAKIVARRLEEVISGADLSWPGTDLYSSGPAVQYQEDRSPSAGPPRGLRAFETPEILMAETNRCFAIRDFDGLVSLMDDNAVDEMAWTFLFAARMWSATKGPDGEQVVQYTSAILPVVDKYVVQNPSQEAQAARAVVFQLFMQGGEAESADLLPIEEFRRHVPRVSELLRNTRGFVTEFLPAFFTIFDHDAANESSMKVPVWTVSVDGNQAIATSPSGNHLLPHWLELRRGDQGWMVHGGPISNVYQEARERTKAKLAGTAPSESPSDSESSLRAFDTPEIVMAELARCMAVQDYKAAASILDDNAIAELTGVFLFLAHGYQAAKDDPTGALLTSAVDPIVQRFSRRKPSKEALAARALLFQTIAKLESPDLLTDLSTDDIRQQLVTASEVITDPREFCPLFATALYSAGAYSPGNFSPAGLKIDQDGDKATVTLPEESNSTTTCLELRRSADGWMIHRLLNYELSDFMHQPRAAAELRPFESPQALLEELQRTGIAKDYAAYVSLLDDNAVQELAGLLLWSMAAVNMEQFQSNGEATDDSASQTWAKVLKNYLRTDAPLRIQQIYSQLTQVMLTAMMSTGDGVDDAARQQLRLASELVTDPRVFCVAAMAAYEPAAGESGILVDDTMPRWSITIKETEAIATTADSHDGQPQTIRMTPHDGGWVVSSLVHGSFSVMLKAQRSNVATPSASTEPGAPEKLTAMRPILAGDRLTWNNVSPFPEIAAPLPKGHPFRNTPSAEAIGKYATTDIAQGAEIREADLAVPSPNELVALKLKGGSSQSLADNWRQTNDLRFDESSIREIRNLHPDWSDDYIIELSAALRQAEGRWTPNMLQALGSLDSLIHVWQEDENEDLYTIGRLLMQWTRANIDSDDPAINRLIHSPRFLSRLARLTGEIPQVVFDSEPLAAETVRKLALLRRLASHNASQKWIAQERTRLAGLLEEAPVPAIMALLKSTEIVASGTHWRLLRAMSTRSKGSADSFASSARVSSVDPVLLLTILAAQTGISDRGDRNITLILNNEEPELDSPLLAESPGVTLEQAVDQILQGRSAYRSHVLRSLTHIYCRTSNEALKNQIARTAPGVPSRAKELDEDTLEVRFGNADAIPRDEATLLHCLRLSERLHFHGIGLHWLLLDHDTNQEKLAQLIARFVHETDLPVSRFNEPRFPTVGELIVGDSRRHDEPVNRLVGLLLDVMSGQNNGTDPEYHVNADQLANCGFEPTSKDQAAIVEVIQHVNGIQLGEGCDDPPYRWHGFSLKEHHDRQAIARAIEMLVRDRDQVQLFHNDKTLVVAASQPQATRIAAGIVKTIQEGQPLEDPQRDSATPKVE